MKFQSKFWGKNFATTLLLLSLVSGTTLARDFAGRDCGKNFVDQQAPHKPGPAAETDPAALEALAKVDATYLKDAQKALVKLPKLFGKKQKMLDRPTWAKMIAVLKFKPAAVLQGDGQAFWDLVKLIDQRQAQVGVQDRAEAAAFTQAASAARLAQDVPWASALDETQQVLEELVLEQVLPHFFTPAWDWKAYPQASEMHDAYNWLKRTAAELEGYFQQHPSLAENLVALQNQQGILTANGQIQTSKLQVWLEWQRVKYELALRDLLWANGLPVQLNSSGQGLVVEFQIVEEEKEARAQDLRLKGFQIGEVQDGPDPRFPSINFIKMQDATFRMWPELMEDLQVEVRRSKRNQDFAVTVLVRLIIDDAAREKITIVGRQRNAEVWAITLALNATQLVRQPYAIFEMLVQAVNQFSVEKNDFKIFSPSGFLNLPVQPAHLLANQQMEESFLSAIHNSTRFVRDFFLRVKGREHWALEEIIEFQNTIRVKLAMADAYGFNLVTIMEDGLKALQDKSIEIDYEDPQVLRCRFFSRVSRDKNMPIELTIDKAGLKDEVEHLIGNAEPPFDETSDPAYPRPAAYQNAQGVLDQAAYQQAIHEFHRHLPHQYRELYQKFLAKKMDFACDYLAGERLFIFNSLLKFNRPWFSSERRFLEIFLPTIFGEPAPGPKKYKTNDGPDKKRPQD